MLRAGPQRMPSRECRSMCRRATTKLARATGRNRRGLQNLACRSDLVPGRTDTKLTQIGFHPSDATPSGCQRTALVPASKRFYPTAPGGIRTHDPRFRKPGTTYNPRTFDLQPAFLACYATYSGRTSERHYTGTLQTDTDSDTLSRVDDPSRNCATAQPRQIHKQHAQVISDSREVRTSPQVCILFLSGCAVARPVSPFGARGPGAERRNHSRLRAGCAVALRRGLSVRAEARNFTWRARWPVPPVTAERTHDAK